jgi:septal ring factor EnvC (AmiA/AmiB activator)
MLNWRRDPDYENRMAWIKRDIAISEQRIQDSERRTKQIESEIEQLREQNARGRQQLASMHQQLAFMRALCFPDDSNSTPAEPTASASNPSLP